MDAHSRVGFGTVREKPGQMRFIKKRTSPIAKAVGIADRLDSLESSSETVGDGHNWVTSGPVA